MKQEREHKPPKWYRFDGWVIFGAGIGLGIAIGVYLFVRYAIFKNPVTTGTITQGDIISATATVLGGFTIGGVAVMQYRKHKWEEYQADYQARQAAHQSKLDEDTKTGERLSKAIEHLGDGDTDAKGKLHVRIGAIYELKRLAEDSARDRENIVQILTAFIKSYEVGEGQKKMPQDIDAAICVLSQVLRGMIEALAKDANEDNKPLRPNCVFEAALAICSLGRLLDGGSGLHWKELKANWVDLRGVLLRGANLWNAQLEGALLCFSTFERAILRDANLKKADLEHAYMKGTFLERASLWKANLNDAHIECLSFDKNNLGSATFRKAILEDVCFYNNTNLENADFRKAHFIEKTRFIGLSLKGVDFRGVQFDGEIEFYGVTIDSTTHFDPGVREKYFDYDETTGLGISKRIRKATESKSTTPTTV